MIKPASSWKPVVIKDSDILALSTSVRISSDGHLESTNNDPHLYLDRKLPKGYYLIRYSIESSSPTSSAKIYYSKASKASYSEGQSLCLPTYNISGTDPAWAVLYLKEEYFIRIDPVDQKCSFHFKHFSIISCRTEFARCFMASNLSAMEEPNPINRSEYFDEHLFRQYTVFQESRTGDKSSQQILRYAEWLTREKYLLQHERGQLKSYTASLSRTPLISIILPVYNTPHRLLTECIESVLNQTYENWELCISDDNSPDSTIKDIIKDYAEKEKRISYVFRETNGHISANSNSALELASGEYYTFLDHDDLLAPHALSYMISAINQEPTAGILYSDEDKIDDAGRRSNPHFKPAFNFEMLLCQNYICHFLCIKADIVKTVNGFDVGAEGCQDHILLIKSAIICSEKKFSIVHIPAILYHWRMATGSTALNASNKYYTTSNYLTSLNRVFKQYMLSDKHVKTGVAQNTYYVDYDTHGTSPLASIIIPTRNGLNYVRRCYESILKHEHAYPNFEVIIVDNQSDDPGTLEWLMKINDYSKTKVIKYEKEFNYSAINNYATENSNGEVLVLLNNDTDIISDNWLSLLVSHASREGVGCVGAMLLYDDDTIQHAGAILGIGGVAGHSHKYFEANHPGYHSRLCLTQEISAVTAACLAVKKSIYESVGGLDDINLKVAFNDIDFCLRVREAGFRNIFEPRVKLYHHESKSRGKEDSPEKKMRFQSEVLYMKERWKGILEQDPFYNPNLTLDREDFSLRMPDFCVSKLSIRSVSSVKP